LAHDADSLGDLITRIAFVTTSSVAGEGCRWGPQAE
jgi:hypothetical protein